MDVRRRLAGRALAAVPALVAAALPPGCAPEDGLPWLRDGGSGDGGADASGSPPGGLDGPAPGDGGGAQGCDLTGAWELTYSEARAADRGSLPAGCVPTRDLIMVSLAGGNTLEVRFIDLEPQQSTCSSPPTAGTKVASATFIEGTCALEAIWNISWCASGEDQCERRRLFLRGDGADPDTLGGTLAYNRCWCGGGPAGVPISATVTAVRL